VTKSRTVSKCLLSYNHIFTRYRSLSYCLHISERVENKNVKVKTKSPLLLIKHRTKNTYGREDVHFHKYLTSTLDGGEWSASPGLRGNTQLYPSDRRLGGPQSRCERSVEKKNLCSCRELNLNSPHVQKEARSRQTELYLDIVFERHFVLLLNNIT
jgi:hypothetical protein